MAFNAQLTDGYHAPSNLHYGTVVSLTDSTLVTLTDNGRSQTHSLVQHSRVVQRGKLCPIADVAAGTRVRITTRIHDQDVASEIECLRRPGSA